MILLIDCFFRGGHLHLLKHLEKYSHVLQFEVNENRNFGFGNRPSIPKCLNLELGLLFLSDVECVELKILLVPH